MSVHKNKTIAIHDIRVRLLLEDDIRVKETSSQTGKTQSQVVREIVHNYYLNYNKRDT